MKAREYIEHKYIPWILFLDPKNTIKQINTRKEEHFCELYNHISKEFNALERYELFMFRVEFSKIHTPSQIWNVTTIKTPMVYSQGDCAYLFIVHTDKDVIYYTADYVLDITFAIKKYHNKEVTIVCNTELNQKEIVAKITMDLMK